ncbi:hypothetical protein EMIHUDRAFT_204323 [Emiliania huxleyi CCMP1516]|uniref:HTTM domain-containing protein n=2 Tax=Emiliania huxleyi TaxID=2903 RepID=A0A0D3JY64_EMIH1|nr:hypothetical protein EMIHUDRAFT_204323 [Emiliania huxleyi CCMP1516]EOD28449.1 hypothetical protein EMIHUDRAFT_204323 [Emiliania huxleyi CCMP1516]|eukprot:XP_005780878.1 hypothetical protein EMIHUDRAFT_204323 [Emiliania huxleyi CCMP1516]
MPPKQARIRRLLARRLLLALLVAGLATYLRRRGGQSLQRSLERARGLAARRVRSLLRAQMAALLAITQQQLEVQVEAALDGVASRLGRRLKDPAMPLPVQHALDTLVMALLPDIKQECWRWTDETFLPMLQSPHPGSPRALGLPAWWALQALGHFPLVGQLWWLVLAALVDRSDEYQLCAFIVGLRVSHFLSLGLGAASYACYHAYLCTLAAAADADAVAGEAGSRGAEVCLRLGPKLHLWGAAFWLLQLCVTLRTFALLPQSVKKGALVPLERRQRLPFSSRLHLASGGAIARANSSSLPADAVRGGLLPRLGRLDLGLAVCAVALAVSACVVLRGARLGATLWWIRTVHGLFSGPYVAFKLPLLDTLLTHARKTGYDRLGHTVPFKARVVAQPHPDLFP